MATVANTGRRARTGSRVPKTEDDRADSVASRDSETTEIAPIDLRDPSLYINRELSLLAFMARVFEEALDERNPLLERVKFLSICGMLLDEFYETRVAELRDQLVAGQVVEGGRDALSPTEQLERINEIVQEHAASKRSHLLKVLIPQLAEEGIYLLSYAQLPASVHEDLRQFFDKEVFPVLTPLAVDAGRPFPHISGRSINLLVVIHDETGERFARIKVPPTLARLVPVPPPEGPEQPQRTTRVAFTWLEQVIAANVGPLFPGKEIAATYFFRVTRNADLTIREAESEDLLETIEESLERRLFGYIVRLEVSAAMPPEIRAWLADQLEIGVQDVHVANGMLGMTALSALGRIDRPDLKDPLFVPTLPAEWPRDGSNILDIIRRRDVLL